MRAWVHTTFVLLTGVACEEKLPAAPVPSSETKSLAEPRAGSKVVEAARSHDAPKPVESSSTLAKRVSPPSGFQRQAVSAESFAAYLRDLALLPAKSPVLDFRGRTILEATDPRLVAVASLDVSPVDLQQCADSIIRLHAEWRWANQGRNMVYYAASGEAMPYALWAEGKRIREERGHIVWTKSAEPSTDYASFRKYLDRVFTYANTGSISRFGQKVKKTDLLAGDFFVLPGSPGHTVLVLDMAKNAAGQIAILLGQGFMPAQQFHVIADEEGNAWHRPKDGEVAIRIPFGYEFSWDQLRRFPQP